MSSKKIGYWGTGAEFSFPSNLQAPSFAKERKMGVWRL